MSTLTPDEIIAMAIKREEEAAAFYREIAEMQNLPHRKELFLDFAKQEDLHKERLQKLDVSDCGRIEVKKVADLKIGDHLKEIEPHKNMDYREALILGMQREKRAYRLYVGLSASTDDPGLKQLFDRLAQEEAGHKLWFETEYDDFILQEN